MHRLLLTALLLAACAAQAESTLATCAAIAADTERLACYDALAAARPAEAAANFGAEALPKKADASESPQQIRARLRGDFSGWEKGTRFELDNGQVWKVTDDRAMSPGRPLSQPAVSIERGLFGSYFLSVEGAGRSAKVQRVQ